MKYKSVMNREFAKSDKNEQGAFWDKSINHLGIWDKVFVKVGDDATLADCNETLASRSLSLFEVTKKDSEELVVVKLSDGKGQPKSEYNMYRIDTN